MLLIFKFLNTRSRDSARLVDIKIIEKALDIYYDRYNQYPPTQDDDWAGWDATYEPSGDQPHFIHDLIDKEVINKLPIDPVNDGIYYYRYKKFAPGSFGCVKAFYVLQAINFEGNIKDHGTGSCPEKNWAEEVPNGYTIQRFE